MSFNKETIEKFKKFEKDLIKTNELIEQLSRIKKHTVDPRGKKIKQKPILNLETYVQLAIHRVLDLANESTNAWNNGVPVTSFLLTRAVYENTAYMYDLSKKILIYYKNDDYLEMHKVIVNRLAGSRLGTNFSQIANVLTVIKAVEKDIPDFREFYDFISDFCHPNYSGMLGIYGEIDKENVRFFVGREFGNVDKVITHILTGLITGLGIFLTSTNNILANIDELNDFFYKHQPLSK